MAILDFCKWGQNKAASACVLILKVAEDYKEHNMPKEIFVLKTTGLAIFYIYLSRPTNRGPYNLSIVYMHM